MGPEAALRGLDDFARNDPRGMRSVTAYLIGCLKQHQDVSEGGQGCRLRQLGCVGQTCHACSSRLLAAQPAPAGSSLFCSLLPHHLLPCWLTHLPAPFHSCRRHGWAQADPLATCTARHPAMGTAPAQGPTGLVTSTGTGRVGAGGRTGAARAGTLAAVAAAGGLTTIRAGAGAAGGVPFTAGAAAAAAGAAWIAAGSGRQGPAPRPLMTRTELLLWSMHAVEPAC